jgi:hypothetical protein
MHSRKTSTAFGMICPAATPAAAGPLRSAVAAGELTLAEAQRLIAEHHALSPIPLPELTSDQPRYDYTLEKLEDTLSFLSSLSESECEPPSAPGFDMVEYNADINSTEELITAALLALLPGNNGCHSALLEVNVSHQKKRKSKVSMLWKIIGILLHRVHMLHYMIHDVAPMCT